MAVVALAARVVEVIADLGIAADSRYRYGSGCIVRGRTVLTAAHVVADAVSVVVRDTDKNEYSTAVDARFVGDAGGPDLALVEIDDPRFKRSPQPIGLAMPDRDNTTGEPVERCHAVGYPWFTETRSRTRTTVRDTVDAIGVIPVLSKLTSGLLSVLVTVAPRALPPHEIKLAESEWSGMSGAPVFAAGCLLGVVVEHAPREGQSAVTAVPLTALEANPEHDLWGPGVANPEEWWSRLGVHGIGDLQRLPVPLAPRPKADYWATLREFGRALHRRMPQLLGREHELAEIAAFATGTDGYRWLVGNAFAGKSALLYEVVTVGLPDEVDVVCYFLSRRASDATSDRFLAAVIPQLAYLCGMDTPAVGRDQYHALWERAAQRAVQARRHLLLVIDGLDEDLLPAGLPSVASLLPTLVGGHAHVLVASRPSHTRDEMASRLSLDPFKDAPQLAELAEREIYDLTHGGEVVLGVSILGLLTAAAGPLSVRDLTSLLSDTQTVPSAAEKLQVRRLVEERAARSLERIGPPGNERYQFAHSSLLDYARTTPDLCDPEFRQRIHRWAGRWRDVDWPVMSGDEGTPRYLVDSYPSTLTDDLRRLSDLVADVGWVETAIRAVGVDKVLTDLRMASRGSLATSPAARMLVLVQAQAHTFRGPHPVDQPGYVLRQLCLQALESGNAETAARMQTRLKALPGSGLVPVWAMGGMGTRVNLGTHGRWVTTLGVLTDGRLASGGDDGRLLIWDPATPGAAPVQLGRHGAWVRALCVLADGRLASGGDDGRLLIWDPATPGAAPIRLGSHQTAVSAVCALPDGRVLSGDTNGQLLVWIVAAPGANPFRLGSHNAWVRALCVLPDGRLASGGNDGRLLIWDPATPSADPAQLGTHDAWVRAIRNLPDHRLISGDAHGCLAIWDLMAPTADPARLDTDGTWITAVCAFRDGRLITSRDENGQLQAWDLAASMTDRTQLGAQGIWVSAMGALPDRRLVTSSDATGQLLAWDFRVFAGNPIRLGIHGTWVSAVGTLPDGRVISSGRDNGLLLMWDPATPDAHPVRLGSHRASVRALCVLPDARVVSGGDDGRVLIWDPAAPDAIPVQLGSHGNWVSALCSLPDGRLVSSDIDGQLLIWNPATPGIGSVQLGSHGDWVSVLCALDDGRLISCGGENGKILVWNPATLGIGPVSLGSQGALVSAVVALPGGRIVSTGKDRQMIIWDVNTKARETHSVCSAVGTAMSATTADDGITVIVGEAGGISVWWMAVHAG